MAKLDIVAGATSVTVNVFIQDSSSTTGVGLSGLVFNSSGLTAYYALPQAASVSITLATLAAATSAWSSGGFKEIDATNMKGWYRFDIPNAVIASGRFTSVHFQGATNMAPLPLEIALTGWNNQDAVHGGLSCLPNTAVTTNASLITSGSGTDQLTVSGGNGNADVKKINAVATTSVTTINSNVGTTQPTNFTGTASSALVKSDMVDVAGAAVSATTAGIPDVNVKNMNNVSASAITTIKAVQGLTTADTIVTVSGNVNGSVASVTGAVGSVTGAVGSVTAAVTLTTGERNSVADALLDRDMSTGTDSGSTTVRTPRQALRLSRNKWSIAASVLTVTKEDDSTTSWTAATTQTAGNPVSAVDPAGP